MAVEGKGEHEGEGKADPNAAPSRRERQKRATRNRLFDLCIDEFRRVGVEKARIRDVVERAGVVPGTFYFHFPTKSHVLLELGNRWIAKVVDQLPGSPDAPADLETLLEALARDTLALEESLGDRALMRATVSSFQHPPSDIPLASIRLQAALRESIAARGPCPGARGLSADELAVLILTAFFGALLVGPEEPRERAAQLHRTLGFFARALDRTDPTSSG